MRRDEAEQHHAMVNAFFEEVRRTDPERWQAVAGEHVVLTATRWRAIRRRERVVGLLALAPSHIAPSVAEQYGYESAYEGEGDD